MWNAILTWIAGWILKYLAQRAEQLVIEHAKAVAHDAERGEINAKNVENYEAAVTEAERIKASIDLLNRTRP